VQNGVTYFDHISCVWSVRLAHLTIQNTENPRKWDANQTRSDADFSPQPKGGLAGVRRDSLRASIRHTYVITTGNRGSRLAPKTFCARLLHKLACLPLLLSVWPFRESWTGTSSCSSSPTPIPYTIEETPPEVVIGRSLYRRSPGEVQKGVRYRCAKHSAGRSGNGTRPLFEPDV
jgi:hypothetical protein